MQEFLDEYRIITYISNKNQLSIIKNIKLQQLLQKCAIVYFFASSCQLLAIFSQLNEWKYANKRTTTGEEELFVIKWMDYIVVNIIRKLKCQINTKTKYFYIQAISFKMLSSSNSDSKSRIVYNSDFRKYHISSPFNIIKL